MKTRLMIILCVAMGAAAVFFGLSNMEIMQKQDQTVTTQQVTRQDNLQLVFMDTRMKITNIQWEVYNTKYHDGMLEIVKFMNTELDLFQQMNAKIACGKTQNYLVYPVLNKSKKVYTNNNINVNTNYNEVTVNPFGKLRK